MVEPMFFFTTLLISTGEYTNEGVAAIFHRVGVHSVAWGYVHMTSLNAQFQF